MYILKGGPGVGKSTFMKKFAAKMLEKGYSVEFVHCSSDDHSLDGIIIQELQVAFVDGTAPHTIDPVIPGAADEIINLGIYLDSKKLEEHKVQIIELNKEISCLYKSAYRYLECAGLIAAEINLAYNHCTSELDYQILKNSVLEKLFTKLSGDPNGTGKRRRLFSEAYTSEGYISHTPSLCNEKRIWAVTGKNSDYASKLLNAIDEKARSMGYDTEGYYWPLDPQKLMHLYIPYLNIFLLSTDSFQDKNYEYVISLDNLMDNTRLMDYQRDLMNNKILLDILINHALERLSKTKILHDDLEAYYKDSVDFSGVDRCFDDILSRY